MRKLILVILVSSLCCNLFAQKTDKKLEQRISALLQGFKGEVGVYVHDLKKNRTVAINADTLFSTASMVKIPILIGVMKQIEDSVLKYHQVLTYKDSLYYAGVDILGSFKNNEKIELSKVMMLMLTMSDNTASLWLQSLAGGGARINELLEKIGLRDTRVNSRTPGRENNRMQYGWGQTTPREMATLMEKIVKKDVISTSASEKMLRLLGRNYWDEAAISQVPSDVFVASKHGALDANRNEVLFVNGKRTPYIFCICTKNNQDKSWGPNNEAWVLAQRVSKLLYDYFN